MTENLTEIERWLPIRMAGFRVFGISSGLSSAASLGTEVAQAHCWSMLPLRFMQFAWLQYWQYNTRHWCQSNHRISAKRVPDQATQPLENRQVPLQEHQGQTEQLGQERSGRHAHLDIPAQRILRWHWSTRPALRKRTPGRAFCRARAKETGFTVLTKLCWTRPMPSVAPRPPS